MLYIKQIYTAFIRVWIWSLDYNIVLLCFRASFLSKVVQLQSPQAHSLTRVSHINIIIFVNYLLKIVVTTIILCSLLLLPTEDCSKN